MSWKSILEENPTRNGRYVVLRSGRPDFCQWTNDQQGWHNPAGIQYWIPLECVNFVSVAQASPEKSGFMYLVIADLYPQAAYYRHEKDYAEKGRRGWWRMSRHSKLKGVTHFAELPPEPPELFRKQHKALTMFNRYHL